MTSQITSQFAKPRIDARALLGLYDPADTTDWGPIRAAQLHAGSQLALFMLAANLVGALLVTMILAPVVPLWQMASWSALVAAVGCAVAFRRLSKRHRAAVNATLRDVQDTVLDGIALGAVWSIPTLAFGHLANANAALGLWIVLSLLMTASAVAMAALPLATITFVTIVGASIVTTLGLVASPVLAGAGAIFTVLLAMSTYGRGKALVVIRASEIALAERDETVSLLLRETEEHAADWLWEIDAQRRVKRANSRFAVSLGVDPKTINGTPFLQVLAGPTWEAGNFAAGLRDLAEKLKVREPFHDLLLPVQVNGDERWWEMSASPRFDEGGAFMGFRGVGSDVTEARKSADKINKMARFDTLTGLPNRLLINEALVRAMADSEKWGSRCAFMMIDLDRFKAVNDTLGHPIGDRLLGRVSERLKYLMSDNEMIGRLGGDEFAVVVRDASDTQRTEALAQTIIDALSKPYEVDQHTLYIGCSVGLAVGPRDGRTAEMLIRSADLALYRSKDAGGGVFHSYEPQLHMAAEERRVLEIALRQAVEKGEMHLNYQPVVDAASGKLTGFEALLRWTHPEMGNISPAKFVPLAEEARLIGPIGEWVLRTACDEAARWESPARVAVNVSPEQLLNPSFVNVVAQALAQSGLPANRLELEVTESVFMREGTTAIQVLEKILDLGIRLSLDDFGTGYSSLGYLAHTRFSSIKIDRSFVQSASKGVKEAIAIIRAVVALADSLGMATTAEGVETEEEHLMIQKLGCTKVQGYYFGRPLPVLEARALTVRPAEGSVAA
ncbi:putative bifunctional diguanylate cyclase/phosphodiesterase [Sphingomonas sp. M1-B02]|uniref:putative bifunctional diguanylate cyclase/phosphodiesterase n=1 Tax=Sphingomonas sp. M1-B02 TaxID=3114300 RepID=UPI00223F8E3C|nr:GGDEF and EAL domain-containing protein [Sphingomonas sp. S6-11]UZK67413.1 EAL domain-containing protein [Sphingomonas sp. S6-11]